MAITHALCQEAAGPPPRLATLSTSAPRCFTIRLSPMAIDHEAAEARARPAADEGVVLPWWAIALIVVAGLALRVWVLIEA